MTLELATTKNRSGNKESIDGLKSPVEHIAHDRIKVLYAVGGLHPHLFLSILKIL